MTREESISQASDSSQTAQEFIDSQLRLEADAREALPYQFDTCSRLLGPLRQKVWSCLTCNPPPDDPSEPYTAAGICYSCHVSCHGEHHLVELFVKRDFVCDCGTTRIQSDCPCKLRVNEATGFKGDVRAQSPARSNRYSHNFRNRFCGCAEEYDPEQEKGTMFQCLGLGSVEEGGCGEDWWHPECLVGVSGNWHNTSLTGTQRGRADSGNTQESPDQKSNGAAAGTNATTLLPGISTETSEDQVTDDSPPLPPGFPAEDQFEYLICYKCVEAFPWIKRYANASASLSMLHTETCGVTTGPRENEVTIPPVSSGRLPDEKHARKRKVPCVQEEDDASNKRTRDSDGKTCGAAPEMKDESVDAGYRDKQCHFSKLPPPPTGKLTLFLKEDFRNDICRCYSCFPLLEPHPCLREEENVYEPPVSESDDADAPSTRSAGSRSLLDLGEAALSNMDRVRAIEGVMVYNHLKDKVKDFLKPFAESGRPVGAEDIKLYFERLRGDAEGIVAARDKSDMGDQENGDGGSDNDGATRNEQSGY